jgi:hypothetical protein
VHQVAEGIAVKHIDECNARLIQRPPQRAARADRTRSVDRLKARYERNIGLGATHDLAESYLLSRFCQTQSAAPTANRRDISSNAQLMSNLHKVVFRDTVAVGNLGDRREPIILERKIHEQAQCVVGVDREAHRHSPASANPKHISEVLLFGNPHCNMCGGYMFSCVVSQMRNTAAIGALARPFLPLGTW